MFANSKSHTILFRPYLRHMDSQGVMYHGEYFSFAEQARTEFLRDLGFSPVFWEQQDILPVVFKCNATFFSPIFLDEKIDLSTTLLQLSPVRFVLKQEFFKSNRNKTTELCVQVACTSRKGAIMRIPKILYETLLFLTQN